MFFPDCASLVGKQGMYLENIYVRPEYRKMGIGEMIMSDNKANEKADTLSGVRFGATGSRAQYINQ